MVGGLWAAQMKCIMGQQRRGFPSHEASHHKPPLAPIVTLGCCLGIAVQPLRFLFVAHRWTERSHE